MTTLGQLNVYASPRNAQPNEQVTSSELTGMGWLVHHRSPTAYMQASDLNDYVFYYETYYLGYDGVRSIGRYWWVPRGRG